MVCHLRAKASPRCRHDGILLMRDVTGGDEWFLSFTAMARIGLDSQVDGPFSQAIDAPRWRGTYIYESKGHDGPSIDTLVD